MRINSIHDALKYFPDIDGFWNSADLIKTEEIIRSRLPATLSNDTSPATVELLTQLGRVQALQGKFPEARLTLDQALELSSGPSFLGSRAKLRWMLEHGRWLCLSMNPGKAHEFFVQAWNMANETKQTFFAIDAALMLATVRPPRFQNEWLQKALALAESGDKQSQLWLTQLLFLDGWHSFDFRQLENALKSFDRALTQPLVLEDESKGFALHWSRARTLRALGRTAEALAIQEMLLGKMDKLGKVNGHVYLEIAECKQALNAQEEAKTFFEMAYADLSADGWYSDNKSDELDRMKYLYKKR